QGGHDGQDLPLEVEVLVRGQRAPRACRHVLSSARRFKAMATIRDGYRRVLLVVDAQAGIVDGCWESGRVIGNIALAVRRARAQPGDDVDELPWAQHDDGAGERSHLRGLRGAAGRYACGSAFVRATRGVRVAAWARRSVGGRAAVAASAAIAALAWSSHSRAS